MLHPPFRPEYAKPYSGKSGLYSLSTRVGNGQQSVVVRLMLFGEQATFIVVSVPEGHLLSPYLAGATPLMVSLEEKYTPGSAKAVIQAYLKRKIAESKQTDPDWGIFHREEARA